MPPADRPTKLCAACGRPFAWRKKWRRDWAEVRYCSDACRTGRLHAAKARLAAPAATKPPRSRG